MICLNGTDVDLAKMHECAERIFAALAFGMRVRERLELLPIRCSIGISIYPNHGKTFEELLPMADNAIYCGKKSGKANDSVRGSLDRFRLL